MNTKITEQYLHRVLTELPFFKFNNVKMLKNKHLDMIFILKPELT